MRIGWIGAGIMGKPMIRHLHHTATKSMSMPVILKRYKTEDRWHLPASGHPCFGPACGCGLHHGRFPQDVQEVYEQLFKVLRPGMTCIDFTTSAPELAIKLYEAESKIKYKS